MKFQISNFKFQIVLSLLLCSLIGGDSAFAHKVNVFAWVEGDEVYTMSYFSDGKEVIGGLIEVYDGRENKLLEGKTDSRGEFKFTLPRKEDLKIVLTASLGHKASCFLPAGKPVELKPDTVSPIRVIAGIGCIFAASGIAFFFLNRRKKV